MLSRAALTPPVLAIALALAIAGCGLGAGPGSSDVSLTVSRNFGTAPVRALTVARTAGSETVLSLLERHFRVGVAYGGGFVESIDGRSGTAAHRDWFYYVNGVEAGQGAGTTAVRGGDRIWWDLHDWTATDSIPAVVGSFPAPFAAAGGHRVPTTLECAVTAALACRRVGQVLRGVGAAVTVRRLGAAVPAGSTGMLVGTWAALAGTSGAGVLAHGPAGSGVYARFADGGRELDLLDPRGDPVRVLGAGAGLVAASAPSGSGLPTWVVAGTDDSGVDAAAAALRPSRLHDRFALAVQGAASLPVPADPAS